MPLKVVKHPEAKLGLRSMATQGAERRRVGATDAEYTVDVARHDGVTASAMREKKLPEIRAPPSPEGSKGCPSA